MKSVVINFMKVSLATCFIFGCAGTPERIDGGPYNESRYNADDMACRQKVKKDRPVLGHTLGRGEMPPTGALSLGMMEFRNCMTDKGWKNF